VPGDHRIATWQVAEIGAVSLSLAEMHVGHAMSATANISLVLLIALPAIAQSHTDRITGQDYQGFDRNDGKGSCCDWHDCRPASAPFMEPDGEKIIDRGNNKFAFDPGKIVRRPSDDGNWHICANAVRLNCIIAPAQSERQSSPPDIRFSRLTVPLPLTDAEIAALLAAAPTCSTPDP
jgi:hypothetical protein